MSKNSKLKVRFCPDDRASQGIEYFGIADNKVFDTCRHSLLIFADIKQMKDDDHLIVSINQELMLLAYRVLVKEKAIAPEDIVFLWEGKSGQTIEVQPSSTGRLPRHPVSVEQDFLYRIIKTTESIKQ